MTSSYTHCSYHIILSAFFVLVSTLSILFTPKPLVRLILSDRNTKRQRIATMVISGRNATGSSSHEYGLIFEIPPPSAVRPGTPFTLPVIVAVRPSGNPSAQQLVANVSLRTESGTSAPGIGGTLTSSVRSRNGNMNSGYAKFSPLTISQPGRYKIRVMLGAASQCGVMTKEFVESGVIHVHGGAAATQKPSMFDLGC